MSEKIKKDYNFRISNHQYQHEGFMSKNTKIKSAKAQSDALSRPESKESKEYSDKRFFAALEQLFYDFLFSQFLDRERLKALYERFFGRESSKTIELDYKIMHPPKPTPEEKSWFRVLQTMFNEFMQHFTNSVAQGRDMALAAVDRLVPRLDKPQKQAVRQVINDTFKPDALLVHACDIHRELNKSQPNHAFVMEQVSRGMRGHVEVALNEYVAIRQRVPRPEHANAHDQKELLRHLMQLGIATLYARHACASLHEKACAIVFPRLAPASHHVATHFAEYLSAVLKQGITLEDTESHHAAHRRNF